jgi:hypothetical protein
MLSRKTNQIEPNIVILELHKMKWITSIYIYKWIANNIIIINKKVLYF